MAVEVDPQMTGATLRPQGREQQQSAPKWTWSVVGKRYANRSGVPPVSGASTTVSETMVSGQVS